MTTDAIQDAFTNTDDVAAIDAVKTAVINELVALDPHIDVKKTAYFNHSVVPDLVVTWQDGSTIIKRPYYLRFDVTAASVGDDIRRSGSDRPAFLGIIRHEHPPDEHVAKSLTEHPDVLVATADAVEELLPLAQANSLVRVVPSAFVREVAAGLSVTNRRGICRLSLLGHFLPQKKSIQM